PENPEHLALAHIQRDVAQRPEVFVIRTLAPGEQVASLFPEAALIDLPQHVALAELLDADRETHELDGIHHVPLRAMEEDDPEQEHAHADRRAVCEIPQIHAPDS